MNFRDRSFFHQKEENLLHIIIDLLRIKLPILTGCHTMAFHVGPLEAVVAGKAQGGGYLRDGNGGVYQQEVGAFHFLLQDVLLKL